MHPYFFVSLYGWILNKWRWVGYERFIIQHGSVIRYWDRYSNLICVLCSLNNISDSYLCFSGHSPPKSLKSFQCWSTNCIYFSKSSSLKIQSYVLYCFFVNIRHIWLLCLDFFFFSFRMKSLLWKEEKRKSDIREIKLVHHANEECTIKYLEM